MLTRRTFAAGLATAAVAPAGASIADPIPALIDEWRRRTQAAEAAQATYDAIWAPLEARGLDSLGPRLCAGWGFDRQRIYWHDEASIREYWKSDPERAEKYVADFHAAAATWRHETEAAGVPAAEAACDAACARVAEIEDAICDTAATTLPGVIAKLRFALELSGAAGQDPDELPTEQAVIIAATSDLTRLTDSNIR